MTFQAYLDNIKEKTGLDPADFKRHAIDKGLLGANGELKAKTMEIIDWLKEDFDLGSGHAMAIVGTFKPKPVASDRLAQQFAGGKAHWKPVFEKLLETLSEHGPVGTAPTDSYISLLKGKAKFAVVATTADRFDVGIKVRDATALPTSPRIEPSGSWNAMVTHRVRVTDPAQVDAELLGWLRTAYDQV